MSSCSVLGRFLQNVPASSAARSLAVAMSTAATRALKSVSHAVFSWKPVSKVSDALVLENLYLKSRETNPLLPDGSAAANAGGGREQVWRGAPLGRARHRHAAPDVRRRG